MKSLHSIIFTFLFALCTPLSITAQTGVIKGKITNTLTNEPLPFATIQIVVTVDLNCAGGATGALGATSEFRSQFLTKPNILPRK